MGKHKVSKGPQAEGGKTGWLTDCMVSLGDKTVFHGVVRWEFMHFVTRRSSKEDRRSDTISKVGISRWPSLQSGTTRVMSLR